MGEEKLKSQRGDNDSEYDEGRELDKRLQGELAAWQMRFGALTDMYQTDLDALRSRVDADNSQTWRRAYCRGLFAYVEGIVRQLSLGIIILRRMEGEDPPEGEEYTLTKLREIDWEALGAPAEQSPEPFLEDLIYAIEEYARMNIAEFEVDRSTQGWASMQSALTIRNRVACPERLGDTTISGEDLERLSKARDWFREMLCGTLEASFEGLVKFAGVLKEHMDRARREESECG